MGLRLWEGPTSQAWALTCSGPQRKRREAPCSSSRGKRQSRARPHMLCVSGSWAGRAWGGGSSESLPISISRSEAALPSCPTKHQAEKVSPFSSSTPKAGGLVKRRRGQEAGRCRHTPSRCLCSRSFPGAASGGGTGQLLPPTPPRNPGPQAWLDAVSGLGANLQGQSFRGTGSHTIPGKAQHTRPHRQVLPLGAGSSGGKAHGRPGPGQPGWGC